MRTSKFLGSVAAVVGGHHVDVGVAQQLVDHLAIVQMIRLFSGIYKLRIMLEIQKE